MWRQPVLMPLTPQKDEVFGKLLSNPVLPSDLLKTGN